MPEFDIINKPKHYNSHPSGVECHVVAEPFGYYLGNALKYIWRCGLKDDGEKGIQDLKKAIWYIETEIKKRQVEVDRAEYKRKFGDVSFEGSDGSQPKAQDLHPA